LPHPGIKPGVRVCRRLGCLRARDGGEHDDNLTNPAVIFEVLSPSTEKYDRGLKFQHYRTLDSLRDYILVNQEQARIEQFTRRPDGTWTFRDYQGPDEELKIDAIGVTIPLRRIYDRVSILPVTN
jgi:Uma2 family endonuclease